MSADGLRREAGRIGERAVLAAVLAGGPEGDEQQAERAVRLASLAWGMARSAALVERWEWAERGVRCLHCGRVGLCASRCPYLAEVFGRMEGE
jgi:ferredoxin